MKALTSEAIAERVTTAFEDVVVKEAYSESSFFYNRDQALPHGVYFLTLKNHDGPNDRASHLDREGVYRVSFKPSPQSFAEAFGEKPKRPKKGESIETSRDLSERDTWQPHAVYGWMGWTMILNPSQDSLDRLWPEIEYAYQQAKASFEKKVRS